MPSFDDEDRAQLCAYVERMMMEPAFQSDRLDTSVLVKKALFRCGLSQNDEWRQLMNKLDGVSDEQIEWFMVNPAPLLSEDTLCILSMALRMRDNVRVDASNDKLVVFTRPVISSNMQLFSKLNAEFSAVHPMFAKETESLMVLHLMCPDAHVMNGTAFDQTHPNVSFELINEQLVPLHLSSVARVAPGTATSQRDQALRELRSLFPHLSLNHEACGLGSWAQALARAHHREHSDEVDQRWGKSEYKTEINKLLGTRLELQSNLQPAQLEALKLDAHTAIAAESGSTTVSKDRLKLILRGLKKDVELLCKHQPSDSEKLRRLASEFELCIQNRLQLLKTLNHYEVQENNLAHLAQELQMPNTDGMDLKTKISMFKKELAEVRHTEERLADYRIAASPASLDSFA